MNTIKSNPEKYVIVKFVLVSSGSGRKGPAQSKAESELMFSVTSVTRLECYCDEMLLARVKGRDVLGHG